MESRNTRLLVLGFCLIPLLSFPRALLADRTLFLRDISSVWLPQVEAVVRQIAAGQLPFFDARRAFGQPLFADPRAEVLYPPAWIHWVLPPEKSYALFCAVHLVIAALGTARLARRMTPGADLSGQWTAGLAFGASGPLLSLVSHWHHLAAVSWMPWIIERCDPAPGARTPWMSLGALVALQILAGSPDYTLTTFLLCFLRLATRTDLPLRDRSRLLAALGLGVLLTAVQTLPSLSFARDAARETRPVGWSIGPLHPALSIETLLPVRAADWPLSPQAADALLGGRPVWMFSHYLGLSVWALAWMGLGVSQRRDRAFALGAIALGLVMSWGIRSESLQQFVAGIPLISGLRFPTKHLAAASLGLALLAGRAASGSAPLRNDVSRGLVVGLAASVILVVALFAWATGGHVAPSSGILLRFVAPLTLTTALAAATNRIRNVWRFAPLAVGLDLLGSQMHLNPTTPATLFRTRPPLTSVLPSGSRLYVSDYSIALPKLVSEAPPEQGHLAGVRPAAGIPYRLRQIPLGYDGGESLMLAAAWYLNPPVAGRFGYFGSFDMDILDFYRAPLKKVVQDFVTLVDAEALLDRLQRGSVDYVVTMDAPTLWASLPLITEERRFFEDVVRVYRVPDPWPRVRFETSDGGRASGDVNVLEMSDGSVQVEGSMSAPGRLVVAVAGDRGWRATLDGEDVPATENAMALLAVDWAPGRHVVRFRYRPPLLEAGLLVTAGSLAALIALSIRARSRGPETA